MKFDKIIYLRYIPLTRKIHQDFYMTGVENLGIKVEYWDFSVLFFKHNSEQEDSSDLVTTIKMSTYQEIEKAIVSQDLSRTLFISIVTYEGRVIKLFKLLTKYDCTLGVFGCNMFPLLAPNGDKDSFLDRLKRITPRKLVTYIQNKKALKLKLNGTIKGYDIMFLGGELGWSGIGIIDKKEVEVARKIMINSNDYDTYLTLKDAQRLIEGDYILFLDEYLPFHPDTKLFNIKNITSEQYYAELNKYFSRVEKQFGMPVVIAAHPKALKYKEFNYFEGRTLYFGKSAELSRDAHFVIAHDSTSVNYSVAFGSRLHFITSKQICQNMRYIHNSIVCLADYLGCNYQWFDHEAEKIEVIEKIPFECYTKYKYDFQTSKETEQTLTKDVFIQFLLKDGTF